MLLLLVDVAMCTQSTQNNNFAISLKCFKKKAKDKYILHEDKQQAGSIATSFLQAGSIAYTGHNQACPKYSK